MYVYNTSIYYKNIYANDRGRVNNLPWEHNHVFLHRSLLRLLRLLLTCNAAKCNTTKRFKDIDVVVGDGDGDGYEEMQKYCNCKFSIFFLFFVFIQSFVSHKNSPQPQKRSFSLNGMESDCLLPMVLWCSKRYVCFVMEDGNLR